MKIITFETFGSKLTWLLTQGFSSLIGGAIFFRTDIMIMSQVSAKSSALCLFFLANPLGLIKKGQQRKWNIESWNAR